MVLRSDVKRPLSVVLIMLLLSLMIAWLPSRASAAGTSYYVDSINGSDSNSGTSTSAAWQSLAKINSTTFQPGDQVLFKAGGIWNGQLWPKGSGSAGQPIVINQYGTGSKPIINGGGSTFAQTIANSTTAYNTGTVFLRNQQYWEINNLEVTNYNPSVDNSSNANALYAGIFFVIDANESDQVYNHIYIQNCYIHDVNGYKNAGAKENGGIIGTIVGTYTTSQATISRFNDVHIVGNTIRKVDRVAIRAAAHKTYTNDNSFGTTATSTYGAWNTNFYIANNTMTDIGGDGIILRDTDAAVVEYNVATSFGTRIASSNAIAAIWLAVAKNSVLQYNEAYGGPISNQDGCAYDFDYYLENTTYQYNYSHDNPMGFMLLMGGNKNDVMRYNVSQNDGLIFRHFASNETNPAYMYNNVFYYDGQSNKISADTTVKTGYTFYNNIFYNASETNTTNWNSNLGVNTFSNNLFYEASGTHSASEPADAYKLTVDPKFQNPGGAGIGLATAAAYQLQTGSPAIAAGKLVANNGGKDYFGNPVSSTLAPSMGIYEGTGVAGVNPTAFTAVDDSFARDGSYAGTNQAGTSAATVEVKADASSYAREGYFKFNFSAYSGTIGNAVITLTPTAAGAAGIQNRVELVANNTWTEGALTWNNKPTSTTVLGNYTITAGTPIQINVTSQVQAAMASGKKISIRVYNTNAAASTNLVSYASSENSNAALRPTLNITP
ncbi:hypothetical protein GCM10008018_50750 [Paenibacillus marchantiophytorum]|uniref:Carbohydrate-binding module family 96 domain-containing protein n=1 Tax=Paenibacillus marchantiophytorum TaxID=1619310 RepID=A0ABQ1F3T6_9BACL|nr:hypothetical protein [Paenibacillus marchantiophytorum]GFZ98346.1 hypothetical protein GCM10008018_50750 [Paenibacillus marchantiophytorum]